MLYGATAAMSPLPAAFSLKLTTKLKPQLDVVVREGAPHKAKKTL